MKKDVERKKRITLMLPPDLIEAMWASCGLIGKEKQVFCIEAFREKLTREKQQLRDAIKKLEGTLATFPHVEE